MGVKKLNWLKIFIQVDVGVKCMQTNFGWSDFSGFGDIVPFCFPSKTAKFPFRTMDHGGQKIELAQNFYTSRG